jgi:ABC-type branched-subunit amino acid transport system ATPase component
VQEQGVSLVIVEQKSVPLARDPDHVLVLRNGRVARELHDELPSHQELSEIYLGDAEKEGRAR